MALRPSQPFFLLEYLMVGILFCGLGCDSDATPAAEGPVTVLIADFAGDVSFVGVRVWTTEGDLSVDRLLTVGAEGDLTLPWSLTLAPADTSPGRWYRVAVELFGDTMCPLARATSRGQHPMAGIASVELNFEELPSARCQAVFVDPSHTNASDSPTDCTSQDSPCDGIRFAVETYSDPSISDVFFVHGGITYNEANNRFEALKLDGDASGEPGRPTLIRAWPGTGTPTVDAREEANSAIGLCCAEDPPRHLIIDGFATENAIRFGTSFIGEVTDVVVRNGIARNNGNPVPDAQDIEPESSARGSDSGFAILNGADVVLEDCLSESNGTSTSTGNGVFVNETSRARIANCVIRDNQNSGIRLRSPGGPELGVDIVDNSICQNGEFGIRAREGARVAGNSLFGNAGDGVFADHAGVELRNNLVVGSGGDGLSIDPAATSEGNWLHGNGDGGSDGEPLFLNQSTCVLNQLPNSPAVEVGAFVSQ